LAWRNAGAKTFLHPGCDALAILTQAQQYLGMS
jgi:hypothetical protein